MSQNELHDISPKSASQMLHDDPRAILVDIRSSMEYLFVGHPVGAVHLPWIDEPDWEINPHFVPEVRKLMLGGAVCDTEEGCAPIVLICRSGKRSKEAGKVLLAAGLSNIFNIDEGFEGELNEHHQRSSVGGWRFHGLPWEQC
jgi:rhodanese-related sulfurtransferase